MTLPAETPKTPARFRVEYIVQIPRQTKDSSSDLITLCSYESRQTAELHADGMNWASSAKSRAIVRARVVTTKELGPEGAEELCAFLNRMHP